MTYKQLKKICNKYKFDFDFNDFNFSDKVDWDYISRCQKLNEPFIKEFADKVNWDYISRCQKLSEPFIKEFADKVDWDYIRRCQKLSEPFIKEYKIEISEDNWLYWSKQRKIDYINNNTSYEIVDNSYIIAYKSIRDDGYSVFNFQYKYEIGETYSSTCDCTDNDASFGLSAWTKEKALKYYNKGKLIKVKIFIEDIGRIVQNDNKIRCFKFTVIDEIK